MHKEEVDSDLHIYKMVLAEEVTFLNKGAINRELHSLPKNSQLEINIKNTRFLDYDILEILDEFAVHAAEKNIRITILTKNGEVVNPESYSKFFITNANA